MIKFVLTLLIFMTTIPSYATSNTNLRLLIEGLLQAQCKKYELWERDFCSDPGERSYQLVDFHHSTEVGDLLNRLGHEVLIKPAQLFIPHDGVAPFADWKYNYATLYFERNPFTDKNGKTFPKKEFVCRLEIKTYGTESISDRVMRIERVRYTGRHDVAWDPSYHGCSKLSLNTDRSNEVGTILVNKKP
ncbi:MAG: hypothetical protein AAF203_02450, partial [Pseudomonadota bacterium]